MKLKKDQKIFNNAIIENNFNLVKSLIKNKKIKINYDFNFPIRYAAKNGYIELFDILLKDKRTDASDLDNAAIRFAAYNGHYDIVKSLIKTEGVDFSSGFNYALRIAIENHHFDIFKLIFNQNTIFIDKFFYYVLLTIACTYNNVKVLDILLNHYVFSKDFHLQSIIYYNLKSIYKINDSLLSLSLEHNNIELISLLLNNKYLEKENKYRIEDAFEKSVSKEYIHISKLILSYFNIKETLISEKNPFYNKYIILKTKDKLINF